ncbi:MAG: hypothetical protein AB7L13_23865 [Acidimicrobiia bacterium]
MAESWFDAYDNVGGAARFDTAAISSAGSVSSPASSVQGFVSTNGRTLVKVAAALGSLMLVWSLQHRGPAAATKVVTVPATVVTPTAPAPVAVLVPHIAQAVTVAPDAPTPAPVVAAPGVGFGDLMANVCGNASTGYRMCRGSHRNQAQIAANWPAS